MNEQKEAIKKAAARLNLKAFAQYEKFTNPKQSLEDNLCAILDEQVRIADDDKLVRRIRYSGFPQIKTFNSFVLSAEFLPNLDFDEFCSLKNCTFLEDKNDVIAIGPEGRGKTHAALAIGHEALKLGYSVKFKRACDMINEMNEAKTEKHLVEYVKTINRCQLLILDEVGYISYDLAASSLLFQVISARYEKSSTFYTSNLEFSKWKQFIGDETLASAIVGRIAHQAIILNMNGPKGWRLEHAHSTRAARDKTEISG